MSTCLDSAVADIAGSPVIFWIIFRLSISLYCIGYLRAPKISIRK